MVLHHLLVPDIAAAADWYEKSIEKLMNLSEPVLRRQELIDHSALQLAPEWSAIRKRST
jgi:hypothetical protein